MYEYGQIGINPTRAIKFYRLSSEQGYLEGTVYLAGMLEETEDKNDEKEAVRLYESIIDKDPSVGYNLGKMYEEGRGTQQSLDKALQYYTIAFDHIPQFAKKTVNNLKRLYELRRIDTTCPICFENFSSLTEDFCSTKCGHQFHLKCLLQASGRVTIMSIVSYRFRI